MNSAIGHERKFRQGSLTVSKSSFAAIRKLPVDKTAKAEPPI